MKKIILMAGLVALGVGLYFFFGTAGNENPPPKYVTVPVERGTLSAEVTCTGTLKPLVEVLVGSQVSGTIKELHADFETQVKKGELIALIDPAMFGAKVAQAEADVEAAKASLAKSSVTLADELRNLKRQTQLLSGNSISQSEFDTAQTKADAARAQEKVDRARVIQAEAKLQEAKLQLDYTRIIAPVNGVVTSRSVDVGQTVAASFQAPVLFKIAEDLTRMQVNTNVDEADIGRVRVGQKAVFTVAAFPDLTFNAEVTQIRNEPQIEQNVVTYNVVLDVDNKGLKLRPGMTANVSILLSRLDDVLMLPDQAFRFVPSGKSWGDDQPPEPGPLKPGERRVWKLGPNGRITPVIVRSGVAGAEKVQILSDDLRKGDRIVVASVASKKKTRRRGMRFGF